MWYHKYITSLTWKQNAQNLWYHIDITCDITRDFSAFLELSEARFLPEDVISRCDISVISQQVHMWYHLANPHVIMMWYHHEQLRHTRGWAFLLFALTLNLSVSSLYPTHPLVVLGRAPTLSQRGACGVRAPEKEWLVVRSVISSVNQISCVISHVISHVRYLCDITWSRVILSRIKGRGPVDITCDITCDIIWYHTWYQHDISVISHRPPPLRPPKGPEGGVICVISHVIWRDITCDIIWYHMWYH